MSGRKGKGKGKASRPAAYSNDADNSGSGSGSQGQTSADLDYMPMRVYQRRGRARIIMERILAASPRFATLSAFDQTRIRETIEETIRENIIDFMHHSRPRTLYPYEEAVLNAVRMTIQWNPDICIYDEAEWQSGLPEKEEDEEQE